jgi:hypothetical protein
MWQLATLHGRLRGTGLGILKVLKTGLLAKTVHTISRTQSPSCMMDPGIQCYVQFGRPFFRGALDPHAVDTVPLVPKLPSIPYFGAFFSLVCVSISLRLLRPAWTSSSICDRLFLGSLCSISFFCDSKSVELEFSLLSSRDKILSYAATHLSSLALRSSYAWFQSRSGRLEDVKGTVSEVVG